jgi:hypothetical protein
LDFNRYVPSVAPPIPLLLSLVSQDTTGTFDQAFNFVTVGSNKIVPVYVRAVSEFPMFADTTKSLYGRNVVDTPCPQGLDAGVFCPATNTLVVGPLLVGKSREDFKSQAYPENSFKVRVKNPHAYAIDVRATLERDISFSTFIVEPTLLHLEPDEAAFITVHAFPKDSKTYEDTIILATDGNPASYSCKVTCEGVVPTLEMESKTLQFDRVLLRRTDTKLLTLSNPCKLPVAWQIVGLDLLGGDVTAQSTQGVIDPLTNVQVPLHFKSLRPIILKKV